VARALAVGGGLGASWGIAARLWMRLIAERAEFSWGGTIFIVAAPTIVGLAIGLGVTARRNGWRPRGQAAAGILAGISVVVLGVGAGGLTLPTIVFGGVAIFRPRISLPARLLVVAGVLGVVLLAGGDAGPTPFIVAGLVGAVIISGLWVRQVLGMLAFVPVVFVWVTIVQADLPAWRTVMGILFYLPLVGVVVAAYGRAIAPVAGAVPVEIDDLTARVPQV